MEVNGPVMTCIPLYQLKQKDTVELIWNLLKLKKIGLGKADYRPYCSI